MEPFLKWAGGKRWLVNKADYLLPRSGDYNRYIEPFLGSGAVFFHMEPQAGILSDINVDLINTYTAIRDNWEDVLSLLVKYERKHDFAFYYDMRGSKPRTPIRSAARFIYLNRTCWNGLYRVNQKGEFNVPIGTKNKVVLDEDNFLEVARLLRNKEIEVCDFEKSIDRAREGDFIFVDPPYTVKHNLNGFVKYNEKIFSWEDQVRLKNAVRRAIDREVKVLVLNADHSSVRSLYSGIGAKVKLKRASVIASDATARGVYSELAIIG